MCMKQKTPPPPPPPAPAPPPPQPAADVETAAPKNRATDASEDEARRAGRNGLRIDATTVGGVTGKTGVVVPK